MIIMGSKEGSRDPEHLRMGSGDERGGGGGPSGRDDAWGIGVEGALWYYILPFAK